MSSALTVSSFPPTSMIVNRKTMIESFEKQLNFNDCYCDHDIAIKDDPMEIDIWCGVLINLSEKSLMSPTMIRNFGCAAGEEILRGAESVNEHDESIFRKHLGESGLKEAEQIEQCVIFEIEQIRREFRAPIVDVSENLRQTGRRLSQFYCSNNRKYENNKSFQYLSYTFERMAGLSVRSYPRMLAKHWLENRHILEEFANHSLSEIGVGVWASPERIVISVLKN